MELGSLELKMLTNVLILAARVSRKMMGREDPEMSVKRAVPEGADAIAPFALFLFQPFVLVPQSRTHGPQTEGSVLLFISLNGKKMSERFKNFRRRAFN